MKGSRRAGPAWGRAPGGRTNCTPSDDLEGSPRGEVSITESAGEHEAHLIPTLGRLPRGAALECIYFISH